MASHRRIVAPRTKREIEDLAATIREYLGFNASERVSMLPLLEIALYDLIEDYSFNIVPDGAIGRAEAVTDTDRPVIAFTESAYRKLRKGNGRERMTAAHEFGHLTMHCQLPTYHAFSKDYDPLTDPERQANIFAAAFLMPERAFRQTTSIEEAMLKFGVSRDAASCRARTLKHKFGARPVAAKRFNKQRAQAI